MVMVVYVVLWQRVPLFTGISDGFIREIVSRLSTHYVLRGEYVFKQGEQSTEMYFVSHGLVQPRPAIECRFVHVCTFRGMLGCLSVLKRFSSVVRSGEPPCFRCY